MSDVNQMKIGIGYNIDTTNLEQLVTVTQQINTASSTAATNLKNIEKAVSDLNKNITITGKGTQNVGNATKKITNEMKAGLISADEAVEKLRKRYDQLNRELVKYQTDGDQKKVNSTKAAMAQTVTAIEQAQSRITKIKNKQLAILGLNVEQLKLSCIAMRMQNDIATV